MLDLEYFHGLFLLFESRNQPHLVHLVCSREYICLNPKIFIIICKKPLVRIDLLVYEEF